MSTEKILLKIRQEAEAEAAAILAAAKEKAEQSAEAILEAARERADAIEKAAVAEAEEIQRRKMLMTGLEMRKNTLRRKREVLDEAFDLAQKRLGELPQDRYEALITKLVLGAAETGTETLLVAQGDRARFESGLLDKLNARLAEAGKQAGLTLSPTGANIQGGVIIEGKKADVNASFEALIGYVRESAEREVAAILFGSEVG
ncbi:MAG: V-type ATP synthase subunit E [Christensenellales bacterium]